MSELLNQAERSDLFERALPQAQLQREPIEVWPGQTYISSDVCLKCSDRGTSFTAPLFWVCSVSRLGADDPPYTQVQEVASSISWRLRLLENATFQLTGKPARVYMQGESIIQVVPAGTKPVDIDPRLEMMSTCETHDQLFMGAKFSMAEN